MIYLRLGLVASLAVATALHGQDLQITGAARPGAAAQADTPESSTGTVTGVVIAQDTQRPARFVQVQFQRIATTDGQGGFGGGGPVNVHTDIDGTFTATHVATGDYYVFATSVGYVSQGALLRAQVAAGADPTALLAALPQVRVTANGFSNVTVTMQRGGTIAGHIEWEDGSPASGQSVSAISAASTAQVPQTLRGLADFGAARPSAQTDDRGNFRISGLATGDYVVSVTVQSNTQSGGLGRLPGFASPIRVFAPGVFHRADAKAISIRAGEERTDARLVIDLRGLHTVSGRAGSANSGETVASGRVQLIDSGDTTQNVFGQIDTDGSFKLRYVPPGTYTLRISGANSQAQQQFRGGRGGQDNGGAQPKGVAYQDFATAITVSDTDVTGVAVSLVPVQTPAR